MSTVRELTGAGQSVWLDFLSRSLIISGGLQRLIDDHGVSGVTSNPSIFARAMVGGHDYDAAIEELPPRLRRPLDAFYELALADIRMAADRLRPTWERAEGGDGFVSFELDPALAHDAPRSIAAATRLVERISRPNLMIKVPATSEGVVAVEELTAGGVNVNVTLLFTVERYEQIARAYCAGLERGLAAGLPVGQVASVASFFVSRVDAAVGRLLSEESPLRARVGVANATVAYRSFRELFSGPRWQRLAQAGARVQRPLWASTATKDPSLSDVMYVEQLVGPDTVTTLPEPTLRAFLDHGEVRPGAVSQNQGEAMAVLERLRVQGIDLTAVGDGLLEDGLRSFDADLHKVLSAIEARLGTRPALPAAEKGPAESLEDINDQQLEAAR